ncbi:MAG: SAM-dependent methyltransferase [Planctomycetota bacterium]
MTGTTHPSFVSRGGEKLAAALDYFNIPVEGLVCADLGSHVGGFVDCLLQRGASRVYSVDTCYGTLAWRLRRDPRVVVLERANALHVCLAEPVGLITIDVAWTPQSRILARARELLAPQGQVVTLIKPQYEASDLVESGVLPDTAVSGVVQGVLDRLDRLNWRVCATFESPIRGHGGNREVFAYLRAEPPVDRLESYRPVNSTSTLDDFLGERFPTK